jgi:tetratricopeptide (TPR) repeat protein
VLILQFGKVGQHGIQLRRLLLHASLQLNLTQQHALLRSPGAIGPYLDSAVNANSRPFLREAAPYIWARATALYNTGKYRQAVLDFNEYEKVMGNQVNANFYYIREQAELGGRQFQQALEDIRKATEMAPEEFIYWAERASLEIRVSMTDDAIRSAQTCINVAPDESDGYLFLGLAQCLKNNKAEGLRNLNIAKEKGNEQADALIQKYAQ